MYAREMRVNEETLTHPTPTTYTYMQREREIKCQNRYIYVQNETISE